MPHLYMLSWSWSNSPLQIPHWTAVETKITGAFHVTSSHAVVIFVRLSTTNTSSEQLSRPKQQAYFMSHLHMSSWSSLDSPSRPRSHTVNSKEQASLSDWHTHITHWWTHTDVHTKNTLTDYITAVLSGTTDRGCMVGCVTSGWEALNCAMSSPPSSSSSSSPSSMSGSRTLVSAVIKLTQWCYTKSQYCKLVHGFTVHTEHAPRQQQFHMTPTKIEMQVLLKIIFKMR